MAGRKDYLPSYKQGFARCAAESEHPELWRGLAGAWYPCVGATGLLLRDLSGFANHGTAMNMNAGTAWIAAGGSLALDFDGADDYISIPGSPSREAIAELTISTRCRRKRTDAWERIAFKDSSDGVNYVWGLQITNANRIQFACSRVTGGVVENYPVESSATITDFQWHDLACTYSAATSQAELWLDGHLVGAGVPSSGGTYWSGFLTASTANLNLGRLQYEGTSYFANVALAHVAIYNRAVTARQIVALRDDPTALFRLRRPVYASSSRRFCAAYRRVLASTYGVSQ